MSDIITRLRGPAPSIPAMRDAADEITRLQQQLADLSAQRNAAFEQAARAFEIADKSMADLLTCEGMPDEYVRADENGLVCMVSDDEREVSTLDEAKEAIREAYAWLHSRGLADIVPCAIYLRAAEL